MVGEVFAGISALKSALDIAKGLKGLDDKVRINEAVIDLQEKILSAQEEHSSLIAKMGELERKLSRLETWETDKKRYELQSLPPGIYVYTLKPGMAAGDPPHRICEKCYHTGKKSILHTVGRQGGTEDLKCFGCGTEFYTGNSQGSFTGEYDPFYDDEGNPRN